MASHSTRQFLFKDNIKALAVSTITVIVVSALLGMLLFSVIRSQEDERATEILAGVHTVFRDAEVTLDYLNALPYDVCNETHLVDMRKALFRSRYVKEIGFYEKDRFSCSTYLGILPTPIEEEVPDFTTALGDIFWINTPLALFEKQSTATIVKRGRYNAVLDMNGIIGNGYLQDWQLFYKGDEIYPIAGNPQLVLSDLTTDELSRASSVFSLSFVKCDKRYSLICLKVIADQGRLFNLHKSKLVLLIIVMLMSAALSHILMFNFLRHRHSLESRIERGLNNGKFFCLYQPVVNLTTREVIGCEVLSRFEDDFGVIYPDEFIAQIRLQDKTWEFTRLMVETAMRDLNEEASIPKGFKVSFNLFPFEFTREKVIDFDWLIALNTKEFALVLEITEDEHIATNIAAKHIKALKSKGFMVAIDDFGVGYSNLGQLKSLNCDLLKIDRSFVMDMEDHSIRSSLIPHIVSIADGLEVSLIAEGVENNEQCEALVKLNIVYGQGWLFGKPQTAEDLGATLRRSKK